MYESFDAEKQVLFRDAEKYLTITSLWKEFSLYLMARKTNYHYYSSFHLTEEIIAEPRYMEQLDSEHTYPASGGLLLLKEAKWPKRKRRVLVIDHSEIISCYSCSEEMEDFIDINPVIIGMDLDSWETIKSALFAVKTKRRLLGGSRAIPLKVLEDKDFKRRTIDRSEYRKDPHRNSRYDLLDIE